MEKFKNIQIKSRMLQVTENMANKVEKNFQRERRRVFSHSHIQISKKTAIKELFLCKWRIRQDVVALKIGKKDLERT